jgi:hypothetical protein
VRNLFLEQCQAIRQEFYDLHRTPPLRINEPRYAGSALWAKALCTTVEEGWDLVNKAKTNSKIPDGGDLDYTCGSLISALQAYQRQKYDTWLDMIAAIDSVAIQKRLDQVSCSFISGPFSS